MVTKSKQRGSSSRSTAQRKGRRAQVRVRRSREDILARLVAAATDEFNQVGYAAATTATIAAKAEVTEAQLFRYFGSKENLFRETIFDPLNRHLQQFVTKHYPENASHSEIRGLYTAELRDFVEQHAGAFTSLIFSQIYGKGADLGANGINSLHTYFERGAAMMRGRTRRKGKIDAELFVRIAFVAVLGSVIFRRWVFPAEITNEATLNRALGDFISAAMTASGADAEFL